MAARLVPPLLLSVPAGIVTDRYDRRLVLLVTDVVRGLVVLCMGLIVVTDGPLWGLVVLALVASGASAFFYPAIGAYIPALVVDEEDLGPANGLFAVLDN